MERSTVDLGIALHEEVFFDNAPPGFCNIIHRFWIFLCNILPAENRSIVTDGVYLEPSQSQSLA